MWKNWVLAGLVAGLAACTVLTRSRIGDRPGDASEDTGDDTTVEDAGDAVDGDAPAPIFYNIGDSCATPEACVTPEAEHCLVQEPPLIGGESIEWQDGYCSSSCDPSLAEPCGSSAVCGHIEGEDTGMCFAGCSIIFRCRNGYECMPLGDLYLRPPTNTVCFPVPEPKEEHLGSACDEDADCGDALDCRTDFFPGGYCTAGCTGSCPDSGGCQETSDIFDPAPATSYCFLGCTSDPDCRGPQYACKRLTDGDPLFCLPATVGSPCVSNGDCWISDSGTSPLCIGAHLSGIIPAFFPGGYCSADCNTTDTSGEDDPCGMDAKCVKLFNMGGTSHQYCLARCEPGRRHCRPGYACIPMSYGHGDTGTFCVPDGLSLVETGSPGG